MSRPLGTPPERTTAHCHTSPASSDLCASPDWASASPSQKDVLLWNFISTVRDSNLHRLVRSSDWLMMTSQVVVAVIGWQVEKEKTEVEKEKGDRKAPCGDPAWWEKTNNLLSKQPNPDSLRKTKTHAQAPRGSWVASHSWADLSTPGLSEGSSEHQAKMGVYQQAHLKRRAQTARNIGSQSLLTATVAKTFTKYAASPLFPRRLMLCPWRCCVFIKSL